MHFNRFIGADFEADATACAAVEIDINVCGSGAFVNSGTAEVLETGPAGSTFIIVNVEGADFAAVLVFGIRKVGAVTAHPEDADAGEFLGLLQAVFHLEGEEGVGFEDVIHSE